MIENKVVTLHAYQWRAVQSVTSRLKKGNSSVGIVAPTGAGKSLIITSILHKMPWLKSAFVAAPQTAIEEGFVSDVPIHAPPYTPRSEPIPGLVSNRLVGIGGRYVRFRDEKGGKAKSDNASDLLSGVNKGVSNWGLTTHSQMARWGTSFLPTDLTNQLLIIDEAHHAGDSEDDRVVTLLGTITATWRERGGQVLYVTATPYRSDGENVFPRDMPEKPWTWTIADHAKDGKAPADFSISTVLTGSEVSTPKQYAGEELPLEQVDGGTDYQTMIDQWIADGKPKAVFVVPAKGSLTWASRLEAALTLEGARVCNAVGADTVTQDRFTRTIKAERAKTTYSDSTVDVFIACKRFDEGTDWPLCSHIYNWGVPASFGLIIQRWGRTFRDKSRYADYPAQFKQVARITFFIGKIKAGAESQFQQQHHEHAWLLGTYLADWETGREYRNSLRIRLERAWSRRPVAKSQEEDELAEIEIEQVTILPDHIRNEATALIGEVELVLTIADTIPTLQEIHSYLEERASSNVRVQELMDAVVTVLAERLTTVSPEAGEAVSAGIRPALFDNPQADVIRRDLIALYRSIVTQYGNHTVPIANTITGYVTRFTGEDAKTIAERLKGLLNKPDFTVDSLTGACRAFHNEHGEAPVVAGGDCSKYFGWPEGTDTWRNVSNGICNGQRGLKDLEGSSLPQFCQSIGLKTEKPDFTVDSLTGACRAFHQEHGDAPTQNSGDCSKYFGWTEGTEGTETWVNVDACIRMGLRGVKTLKGSSLHQFCQNIGLKTETPDFTVDSLTGACRAFHNEHGKAPIRASGDCSKYFGWTEGTETWENVNNCIRVGRRGLKDLEGSSLHQFCQNIGLKTETPDFTVDSLEGACRAFHQGHGEAPIKASGDCSKYFGWTEGTETWKNVSQCIRMGIRGLEDLKGSSLHLFCQSIGLK